MFTRFEELFISLYLDFTATEGSIQRFLSFGLVMYIKIVCCYT